MSTRKCLLLLLGLLVFAPDVQAHMWMVHSKNPIYLGPVSIELRSGSRSLPTFAYRGTTYVLGQMGERYSVWVQNRTGQRLEVVVSVDGRDVISGQQARGFSRRGYILNPYRYVDITGFRTSQSSVATFRFTSIPNSYASRMGTSWHRVGNIHVALFRERAPVSYVPRPIIQHPHRRFGYKYKKYSRGAAGDAARPAAPNQKSSSPAYRRGRRYDSYYIPRRIRRPTGLGTAYGEYRYAPSSFTTFERATSYPSYQLSIGYNNCSGFRYRGICTRWCACYRDWYRRYRYPRPPYRNNPLTQPPTYAPPPPSN